MKRGTRSAGFTIVETMVVLAVSGIIFVAVAIALGGKQNASKFSVSIEDIRSQIQQIGTDVVNGYYPATNSFRCSAGGGGTSLSAVASVEQGTNGDCVFMGKVMQFGLHNSDPQEYQTYSVAGLRAGTSLSTAKPLTIAPGSASPAGFPNVTDTETLENGLTVTKMKYTNGLTSSDIGAFAYLYAFPGTVASGGYQNGPTQVDIYALTGTSLNNSSTSNTDKINLALSDDSRVVKNPSGGIQICFKSGSTANQYGLVTIGGGNRQLAVELQVKSTADCGL